MPLASRSRRGPSSRPRLPCRPEHTKDPAALATSGARHGETGEFDAPRPHVMISNPIFAGARCGRRRSSRLQWALEGGARMSRRVWVVGGLVAAAALVAALSAGLIARSDSGSARPQLGLSE